MNDVSRELGKAVIGALGDGPSDRALAAQRATLLMRWHTQRVRPFRPRGLRLALSFGVAAVVATLALWTLRRSPVDSPATWQGTPITENERVRTAEQPGTLQFSNGTRIDLEPESSAQVAGLGSDHTEVSLQKGRLDADVRKTPGTAWSVAAGPYRVHVIGTQFSVAWQPRTRAFSVAVTRGEVRVSGGELPEGGVRVRAGGHLDRRDSPNAPADAPRVPANPRPAAAPDLDDAAARDRAENGGTLPAAGHSGKLSADTEGHWRKLAADGRYEEALKRAEQLGIEGLLDGAPAADLLVLGNAARFTGSSLRARQAYSSLRARFPADASARLAAFYLARLAADVEKQPGQAVQWYEYFSVRLPRES